MELFSIGYNVSNIYLYQVSHGTHTPQFGETITDLKSAFLDQVWSGWSQALEYSPATGGFITILPGTNATFTRGKAYYFLTDRGALVSF